MSSKSKRPSAASALAQTPGYAENLRLLFESGNLLAVDIDKFPVAILITSKEGIVRQVNNAFCELFGYSALDVLERPFTALVHPEDQERLIQSHSSFFQAQPGTQTEWMAVDNTGKIKWLVSSDTLFTDRKREICKATFIQDITKIKEPEPTQKDPDPAWKKNLEVLELAESMVLHDVRKPIANIIGICNLLLNAEYDQLKLKKWLQVMKSEAGKASDLLDTKSGFKKMELNTYLPELSTVDVIGLTRKILAPLEPKIRAQKIKVTFLLNQRICSEHEVLNIIADGIFIEIMLNNLIVNAIEASPEGGELRIAFTVENKTNLKFIITNEGTVPGAVQNSFFGKHSTYGKPNGLGLGTYTARLIARAHKGDITFTTSDAEGTSLQVFLPGIMVE